MLQESIAIKKYESGIAGPHLLVFGAVHGNEPCGPSGINSIGDALEKGEITLLKGSLSLVPICNPAAYAENRRFIEEDLNRVFRHCENPVSYEARLANTLTNLIDTADVFLDIHSATAPGPVSVFIDFPTDRNEAFARALGAEYALLNWPELYEGNEFFDSYDTTRYAFEAGKDGVLIECGQHGDPLASIVAHDAIVHTLSHYQMIDDSFLAYERPTMHSIKMIRLERKEEEGDVLTERWEHLQRIPSGTIIAVRASGEQMVAENDCVMLLPKYSALPGNEWFYVGIEV